MRPLRRPLSRVKTLSMEAFGRSKLRRTTGALTSKRWRHGVVDVTVSPRACTARALSTSERARAERRNGRSPRVSSVQGGSSAEFQINTEHGLSGAEPAPAQAPASPGNLSNIALKAERISACQSDFCWAHSVERRWPFQHLRDATPGGWGRQYQPHSDRSFR
jgi:hypothetical protein